jgi:hypothetical protein
MYTPLVPVHKLLSNTSIAKGATNSPAVLGGATTVPTDATSVQLLVSVKSTQPGHVRVYPAGNPGASTSESIFFDGGDAVETRTTGQSAGLSSKVSITNFGIAAATVTVTIIGYSTQVTASGISGSGGDPGEVLTNTGAGAKWGQAGAPAYAGGPGPFVRLEVDEHEGYGQPIVSVTVPAGSYLISAQADVMEDGTVGESEFNCFILSSGFDFIGDHRGGLLAPDSTQQVYTSVSLQSLVTTPGATFDLRCETIGNPHWLYAENSSIIATQVSSANGDVVTTSG